MKIVIGNDHAAVDMKFKIKEYIESMGHEVINVGTDDYSSCDYPDIAYAACEKIKNKEVDLGVLICGTGVGMSLTANKVKGIRACVCSETYSARLCREHNDANVLCFGERVIGIETAKELVSAFLNATFEGGKHKNRVDKILSIEEGTYKK
ncbi:MAG: ribose 5-phosphate isomerase B [Lachnospiraceae bacterium]|nr:ribose 5-phosphate isomerase B [Lachnospiraceae bacterium]